MFRYFPDNYGWSLIVLRCLVAGGHFGEIDWICRGLVDASKQPPGGDREAWYHAWRKLAEQVVGYADERLESDHKVSAGDLYYRAAQYFQWAEALLSPKDARAKPMYDRHLAAFERFTALSPAKIEIVDIPFEGTSLKSYFSAPAGDKRPVPCVIVVGGLDGNKEEMYPLVKSITDRGLACLGLDLPGQGATLRDSGLPARYDTEVPVGAAIDYLVSRDDVIADRIGMAATSAGGYYAPRAAAYEKRIKACVPWAAIYDYHAIWMRRLAFVDGKPVGIRPEIPFPVTADLVLSIMGVDDWSAALKKFESFRLEGVAKNIECDLLVVQGEDDPQTPLPEAERLFQEASSANKILRVYRREEGGSGHVQVDRQEPAMSMIADWLTDRLMAS